MMIQQASAFWTELSLIASHCNVKAVPELKFQILQPHAVIEPVNLAKNLVRPAAGSLVKSMCLAYSA